MNAEKWLWLIFGCKVGLSVPIGMKLKLDMWHYLLYEYIMFQIDISKHVEKARKISQNPKRTKIINKIPKIRFLPTTELMSRSIQQAIYLPTIYKATIAKIEFDLFLAVNQVKVTQLWWNPNSIYRATYSMHIPRFKLISQSIFKKVRKTRTDGRTDGRTSPWHNTSVFQTGV